MTGLFILLVVFLSSACSVPLTINCEDVHTAKDVEACVEKFREYYDKGVDVFKSVDDSRADEICSEYQKSKSCIVVYMHFCPDVKKIYAARVKAFEFACTADRTGDWPYSPTVIPPDEEDADVKKKNDEFYSDMVKVSVAAFVTLLLVLACATAELAMKLKLSRRIKKATNAAAAASAANADQEALLKKSEEEEGEPKA